MYMVYDLPTCSLSYNRQTRKPILDIMTTPVSMVRYVRRRRSANQAVADT